MCFQDLSIFSCAKVQIGALRPELKHKKGAITWTQMQKSRLSQISGICTHIIMRAYGLTYIRLVDLLN